MKNKIIIITTALMLTTITVLSTAHSASAQRDDANIANLIDMGKLLMIQMEEDTTRGKYSRRLECELYQARKLLMVELKSEWDDLLDHRMANIINPSIDQIDHILKFFSCNSYRGN